MYIFGPVPSRRLGLSLGVDLIAGKKVCNNNCIYCELGRTLNLTNKRQVFVETEDVLSEIKDFFNKGGETDFVTFSGSGEPTLALNLGEVISAVKKIRDKKIALLTNSVLFCDENVRKEAALSDVVLPSIDAGSEEVFKKINRPHESVDFNRMISGLIKFSKEPGVDIKPEVLIVKGFNDSDTEVLKIKKIIDSMDNVSEIQVNTVVRSRAEKYAEPAEPEKLKRISGLLGKRAVVIGEYKGGKTPTGENLASMVISGLKKRPMTINDISQAFEAPKSQIKILVEKLHARGEIEKEEFEGKEFYKGK